MAINKPDEAADITVFMTMRFGLLSSTDICKTAPEFMNREVIKIIKVPASRKLISSAKNVRLLWRLYILNINFTV